MDMKLMMEAYKVMLHSSLDMVFIKDKNLKYQAASMPFVKMTGKSSVDEIVNKSDLEIFEDSDLAKRYISDDQKLISKGEDLIDYMEPLPDENGNARYGSTSKYILRDDENNFIGILGITRDITREYFARQRYQQELKYLFKLPEDTLAVSFIDIDSWRIISQRRQSIENGTYQSCYTVEELCDAAVVSIIDKNSKACEFYRNFSPNSLWDIYASGRSNIIFKYQRKLSDGSIRWVRNEVRFLIDVDSGHLCAVLTAKDINAKKVEEQNLIMAAKLDKMTMLLNRETTMEYIREILLGEADSTHVLFMLDVDNFKNLNDTLGHQAGDEFLVGLATKIKKSFRENDIVGRIGGDEFFMLMRNVPDKSIILDKAQNLLETIKQSSVNYPGLQISASIGISIFPDNGLNLDELYSKADEALYIAKRGGKNQFVFAK